MRARKVVHADNLPLPWKPLGSALLWFLALDRFNAPGWLYGVAVSLWVIMTLVWVWDLGKRTDKRIWE